MCAWVTQSQSLVGGWRASGAMRRVGVGSSYWLTLRWLLAHCVWKDMIFIRAYLVVQLRGYDSVPAWNGNWFVESMPACLAGEATPSNGRPCQKGWFLFFFVPAKTWCICPFRQRLYPSGEMYGSDWQGKSTTVDVDLIQSRHYCWLPQGKSASR